jgi:large subunit ribosomal protein L35
MAKQKMKTLKSLARRVKLTKSGKLLHGSNYKRHLSRNKTSAQKRRYRGTKPFDNTRANKYKKALGII